MSLDSPMKRCGIPMGRWFIRIVDGVDVTKPEEAANGRVVFELRPI